MRQKVSVPLDKALVEYIARVAEREAQSRAAIIRRLVAEAARRSEAAEAAQ
jgi:metal-responsive CopG/Arc/MetJ family transcriptional regulator